MFLLLYFAVANFLTTLGSTGLVRSVAQVWVRDQAAAAEAGEDAHDLLRSKDDWRDMSARR